MRDFLGSKKSNNNSSYFVVFSDLENNFDEKNIEITAHYASKNAQVKIEKAGGKLSIIKK